MRVRVGTSGFSFPEWRGAFYPEDLPAEEYLGYYAQHLDTVEINNTFYKTPRSEMLEKWRTQVPPEFCFALKASRRITHIGKLQDFDSLAFFWERARALGPQLGPILFQLPPTSRGDPELLRAFLERLPEGCAAALEFRHATWRSDAVLELLRARHVPWVTFDDRPAPVELLATADWGYVRMHRPNYSDAELHDFAARLQEAPWKEAHVFFSHEDDASGAHHAIKLRAILAGGGGGAP